MEVGDIPWPSPAHVGSFWAVWVLTWNIHSWAMLGGASPHFQRPLIVRHPFVTRLAASRSTWARKATGWTVEPNKRWNLNQVPKVIVSQWTSATFRGLWTIYRSLVRGRSHIFSESHSGDACESVAESKAVHSEDSQEQKAIMRTNHSTTRKLMDMVRLEAFQWPWQALHCLEFPIFV